MRRRIVVACLWVMLLPAIGVWAIEAKGSKEKVTGKAPVKVGALFSVTGPAAWLGEPEKNTAMMLVEEINAKGGVNGHPIELIVEDTEGDNTKAVLAAKKLISSERVDVVIGPSRSGTTMAVVPIFQAAQVPLVSCAALAAIVEPVEERKWIFKTPQMDSDCVTRIYEHMQGKGIKKVALITGTTGFGKGGRDQLKKLGAKMGMEIVADKTYGPGDTNMTAQLTTIKASGAQALVNWSIVPAQSIVPKDMKKIGLAIPLYQSHGFGNLKYVQLAGPAAEGIIFPAGPLLAADTLPDNHPQKKLLLEYRDAYEKKYGDPASTFGGHAYDATMLVIKAIELGGPSREGIRDGLEKVKGYVGTAGIFNLSPTNHVGLDKTAFEILTVKNGKFVLLQE